MKFCKMCWYDIKNGCLKNFRLFLLPIVMEVVVLLLMAKRVGIYEQYDITASKTLGDVLLYHFGGMGKYVLSADKAFEFPVIWMILFVLILFVTLDYPVSNLQGFGSKVLVKGNSRIRWWLAKCVWNLICNVVYFGIIFLLIILFCSMKGIPFSLSVNSDLQTWLFELDAYTQLLPGVSMPIGELVQVFLVSVAICQLQMALVLWLKPIYSFMVMCMFLLVSAYFQNYVLWGNYAMLLRHSWINEDGMDCRIGIPVTLTITLITVCIGMIRFKGYNIMQEEN